MVEKCELVMGCCVGILEAVIISLAAVLAVIELTLVLSELLSQELGEVTVLTALLLTTLLFELEVLTVETERLLVDG